MASVSILSLGTPAGVVSGQLIWVAGEGTDPSDFLVLLWKQTISNNNNGNKINNS